MHSTVTVGNAQERRKERKKKQQQKTQPDTAALERDGPAGTKYVVVHILIPESSVMHTHCAPDGQLITHPCQVKKKKKNPNRVYCSKSALITS